MIIKNLQERKMAMSLRDKLKSFAMDNHIEKYAEHNANKLEQIVDDFATEFLDSIREYERESGSRIWFDERDSKELLQIFKNEKEL